MGNNVYAAFAVEHPACARQIASLAQIENAVSSLCFPPFFEPVSVMDNFGLDTSPRLLGPMALALHAWTRHVAYGTIARLRDLTEPLIYHLSQRRLTISSILQRTVLENAGRAAFTLGRLTDVSRSGSWDDLRALIPKTLFGTCMTDLKNSVFEDFSEFTAQRPVKVGKFIDALEDLAGTEDADGQSFFSGLYSLLCDLTHASQRANQGYCRVLETRSEGWKLQYAWEEETTPEAIEGAVKSAMRCLQAGYAGSAMLLAWDFAESAEGLKWHSPSESDAEWIWRNLLDPSLVF